MHETTAIHTISRRGFLAALGVTATAVVAACDDDKATSANGPDLSGANSTTRPSDDLFRHVNGTWLRDTAIPADKTRVTTFDDLTDTAQRQLKAILEAIEPDAGGDDRKIRDVYDSYLDTAAIDAAGIGPIRELLDSFTAASTKDELLHRFSGAAGVTGLVTVNVAPDQKNATNYTANLGQSGLGMPDESYYREPDYADIRSAYAAFLEKLAGLAQLAHPAETSRRVMAVESAIAKGHWDNVRTRDARATYNPYPWDRLSTLAPGIAWQSWRESIGGTAEQFTNLVVAEPSFLTHVAALWNTTGVDDLRDFCRLTVLRDLSPYLPKAFADAHFDFFQGTLKGAKKQPDRWKGAVTLVDELLGEALGKRYVEQHFPVSAKRDARKLVDNLLAAYRNSFTQLSWMTQPTRDAAIVKLDKINVKIGYPDKWRDYGALAIRRGQLLQNYRAAHDFEFRRQLAKLGHRVNKDDWQITPQTVNAYYDPSYNEIVFPAAILQAPFFSPDAAPAVNYGGIGAVIGHEIGHGFDDQGAQYDGDGNLRDWWTPADRDAFTAKTKALVAQYNTLVPEGLKPSQHVNGELTVGENLADLGGLSIGLAAYRIAIGKDTLDLNDVFLSWGRIWRGKLTPQRQAQALATDPHSPSEFRCNQVVRNLPDFYTAFGVAPTDKLYLPPEQRVSIW